MSTSESELGQLFDEINAVPRDPPLAQEFQELDFISDVDEADYDELLAVFFDEEDVDRWVRFPKRMLYDLEEVR